MNIFLTNKFQSTRDDVHNVGPVLHEFIIEQLVFYSVGHVMRVNHLPPKFLNATTTTQESVQDDLVTRGANSWLVARMPKKELQVIRTTTTTATRKTLTRTSTKNWVTTNCLYYIISVSNAEGQSKCFEFTLEQNVVALQLDCSLYTICI